VSRFVPSSCRLVSSRLVAAFAGFTPGGTARRHIVVISKKKGTPETIPKGGGRSPHLLKWFLGLPGPPRPTQPMISGSWRGWWSS
jgi:hypothetical protein